MKHLILVILLVGCNVDSTGVSTLNLDLPDGGCLVETEICNDLDDDCDSLVDEGVTPTWYADCDGDGYAAIPWAATANGCAPPAASASGCDPVAAAAWTTVDPYADADCADYDARAFPGANQWQASLISSPDFVDEAVDCDFDCDGIEDTRWDAVGGCALVGGSCVSTMGWSGSVAACGTAAAYVVNCTRTCTARTNTRQQTCR